MPAMPDQARQPFMPSPRPEPPLSVVFASAHRAHAESIACIRRAGTSTRTYVRGNGRTWRWLFLLRHPSVANTAEARTE